MKKRFILDISVGAMILFSSQAWSQAEVGKEFQLKACTLSYRTADFPGANFMSMGLDELKTKVKSEAKDVTYCSDKVIEDDDLLCYKSIRFRNGEHIVGGEDQPFEIRIKSSYLEQENDGFKVAQMSVYYNGQIVAHGSALNEGKKGNGQNIVTAQAYCSTDGTGPDANCIPDQEYFSSGVIKSNVFFPNSTPIFKGEYRFIKEPLGIDESSEKEFVVLHFQCEAEL